MCVRPEAIECGEDSVRPEKILVVNDQQEVLELLRTQLELLGWETVLAHSGSDAFEKLKDLRPSIMLVDLRMPGMDGLELTRVLKQHADYQTIPILAFSAFGMPRDRQQCLDAGCDDYLAMPFTLGDLKQRLIRLVAARLGVRGPTPILVRLKNPSKEN